jgi:hypothetical protein
MRFSVAISTAAGRLKGRAARSMLSNSSSKASEAASPAATADCLRHQHLKGGPERLVWSLVVSEPPSAQDEKLAPMRFVGYSCRHAHQPLRRVFLPLSDFTVLLGRNDSGKSSLLRAVERDLSGGHYEDCSDEERPYIGAAFFFEADEGEFDSLIRSTQGVREEARGRNRGHLGRRPPWGMREWKLSELPVLDRKDKAQAAAWLAALLEEAQTDVHPALAALACSRLVSFEPAGFDRSDPIWNVSWCLPPDTQLTEDVKEALARSGLLPYSAERKKAERGGGVAFTRSLYTALHGEPNHLWCDGAPTVVAPIGQTRSVGLPQALSVPVAFPKLHNEVRDSINELTSAARHGMQMATMDGDPLSVEEEDEREAPRNWLEQIDGKAWRLHPDAQGAAAFLAGAANRVVPGFLGSRYQLRVEIPPVDRWASGSGEALELKLRERRDDALVEEFAVEEAAEGLRLWVQLALLWACEQASRLGRALGELADEWWVYEQNAQHPHPGEDVPELEEAAKDRQERFVEACAELRALGAGEKGWPEGHLAGVLEKPDSADWTKGRHRRLFIVDEPERHLHPNLQREAASWLRETNVQQGGLCLLATHGTPFLALPNDQDPLLYVYAERTGKGTVCKPFDADEINKLDRIVSELGFDRGELLTTVSLFLIVEGIHDLLVLDRVFGELRAARIALLPLDGLSNYKAVLDSDALWRYTTAEVALSTDKFEPDLLREVIGDPKKAKELRKADAPEETKMLGKLIGNAERNGKRIYLLGHRGADLIDVLDEAIVKGEFPGYPGHEEAQRLWSQELESGANAGQRKGFYERHFKIPTQVDAYARLGEAHATAGAKPPALQRIVDEAISLSRGRVPQGVIATTPS